MVDGEPPRPKPNGARMLLLLTILLAVIAALAAWAWLRNPPDAPDPSSTAAPETVPGGEPGQ